MANKAGSKQYSKRQTQQPRPANPIGEVLGTIATHHPFFIIKDMIAAKKAKNTAEEMQKTYRIKKD